MTNIAAGVMDQHPKGLFSELLRSLADPIGSTLVVTNVEPRGIRLAPASP